MPAFDGIWEVRVNYQGLVGTQTLPHVLTFDVQLAASPDPGTEFADIPTLNHDLSEGTLKAVMDDFMDKILDFFPDEITFLTAELWKYPEGEYDGVFYGVYALSLDGLHTGTMNVAGYSILTWRSIAGGIMKIYLLETAVAGNGVTAYPTGNTLYDLLFTHFTRVDKPFVARDNSRPIAPLKLSQGQNEALWRRRYRS